MARKNSGYLCKIDTGGKAIARHREQEPAFKELKKHFIHYLTDDFHPVLIDGKPRTGLIDSSRLTIIGMVD